MHLYKETYQFSVSDRLMIASSIQWSDLLYFEKYFFILKANDNLLRLSSKYRIVVL